MNGKYKLAVGVGFAIYMSYGGRYIRFNEVLDTQKIELNEQYASLAVF